MKGDTNEETTGRTSTGTGTWSRAGDTVTRRTGAKVGVVGTTIGSGRRVFERVGSAVAGAGRWAASTVTPVGWFLVGLLVLGAGAGIALGWVEGWVVGIVAGVLLIAAVPFLLGGTDFEVALEVDDLRVVAGSDVTARLTVTNRGGRVALPSVIDVPVGDGLVEAHVPLLVAGAAHVEQVAIGARRRGVIDVGPMTIARGDPIGILRREVSWPQVEQIFVHPPTTPLPATSAGFIKDVDGNPTSRIVDADLSFHAIREYLPGDSQRHVHWKATARTGKLMVRQFEESRHARIAILLDLDIAEFESDDEFEMAVSAASSLGLNGVREGRDVLVAVSAPIPEFSRDAVMSINTVPTQTPKAMLDGMAAIESRANVMRLEAVTALTAQSFPDLSIAFLVTGSRMPLTRMRQAAITLPARIRTVAVRCEPGAEPSIRTAREITVITIGALDDLTKLLARGALR